MDCSNSLSFVCAMRRENTQHVRLRSYSTTQADEVDCKIWEAARATSAAPAFFDPIKIGPFGEEFIDGAIGANNPIDEVLAEARSIWPDADKRIQCIVSIGTGVPEFKEFGKNAKQVAENLLHIATEADETARKFLSSHSHIGLQGRYFRFNVPRGLESVKLDEYEDKAKIAAATKAYLVETSTELSVKACASILQNPNREQADSQDMSVC